MFLIRLTSFPILLVIRLCEVNQALLIHALLHSLTDSPNSHCIPQRHSFRAGLELTAERAGKAFSWVPLPRALEGWRGKGEVDIVEAVFCRENIALEAESWDDWNEPKDTQAPEGTDAASVKEHSDDEHEHELESHSTPHEPEAVRTSRTAGPSRGRQNRFSGAPLQMHKARGSFEQARIEGEPATVPRERSSGQLPRSRTMQDVASRVPTAGPSPLARIFSGAARGISPSVHWKPPSAPSSPGYDPSNWIGRGTFSGALDRCVEERENAELPHAVIDRLNSMEQRQQRIEVSRVLGCLFVRCDLEADSLAQTLRAVSTHEGK